MSKGLLHAIRNYKPTVVEYNPEKFWKENTIESIFKDLQVMAEKEKKWKEETGWKPQYFLSAPECKQAPLSHLEWLCKNYDVIGGSEACRTLQQRQIIINYTSKNKKLCLVLQEKQKQNL